MRKRWFMGVVSAPANDPQNVFSDDGHIEIDDCPYPVQVIKPHHLDAHIIFHAPCGQLHLVTLPTGASVTNIATGKRRTWVEWDILKVKKYLMKEFERPPSYRVRRPNEPAAPPSWAEPKQQRKNPLLRAWHWFKTN